MIVGLTGGIATGKSTVSENLVAAGFRVFDADQYAREVVAPGSEGLREIVAAFGAEYLQPDGSLDRAKLGVAIFANSEWRARLNEITHPRVRAAMWRHAREFVDGVSKRIAILDVPLLMEGGTHIVVDVTVLVYATAEQQLARLIERNGLSAEIAKARMDAQWPIEHKRELADIIVDNSGPISEVPRLTRQLIACLEELAERGAQADGTFDKSVVIPVEIQ